MSVTLFRLADFQKQRAELEHRIRELNDKLSAITGKEEEGAPEAEKKKADAPTAAETPKKEEKPQAEEKKEESKKDDKKDKKEDEKKKKEEEKKKKEEEKKKKEEEEKKKKEEEKKKKEEEKKKEQERKQTKGKKAIVKPAATKEDLHGASCSHTFVRFPPDAAPLIRSLRCFASQLRSPSSRASWAWWKSRYTTCGRSKPRTSRSW